jgi:hypothetical protein
MKLFLILGFLTILLTQAHAANATVKPELNGVIRWNAATL